MTEFIKKTLINLFCLMSLKPQQTHGFLIPAYTGLGNFILMSPMVCKLRHIYPQAAIYILAGNHFGTQSVFQSGDGVATEILWLDANASLWKRVYFFTKMRKLRISTAFVPFDASPSFFRWGILLAGIPRRIGHTLDVLGTEMGWTRDALTDPVALRLNTHESDLHFDLLERLEPNFKRTYDTHISCAKDDTLNKFALNNLDYVVIQLAAANAQRTPKIWALEKFAELIPLLLKQNFTVILPGDVNEAPLITKFSEQFDQRVINLAGKTNILEISRIIKSARLLICHDSGLMHIGNAHHTPLLALYGPTDWVFTAPKASTSHILRESLPCQPCMKNFAKTEQQALFDCPIDILCMRNISVKEAYETCLEILNKYPPKI
ncbi:MAG: glycosyltransferase family 9 protein [Chthoniobacterales bacterium]